MSLLSALVLDLGVGETILSYDSYQSHKTQLSLGMWLKALPSKALWAVSGKPSLAQRLIVSYGCKRGDKQTIAGY